MKNGKADVRRMCNEEEKQMSTSTSAESTASSV